MRVAPMALPFGHGFLAMNVCTVDRGCYSRKSERAELLIFCTIYEL